eukprot:3101048-Rhodomonas_salina.2
MRKTHRCSRTLAPLARDEDAVRRRNADDERVLAIMSSIIELRGKSLVWFKLPSERPPARPRPGVAVSCVVNVRIGQPEFCKACVTLGP